MKLKDLAQVCEAKLEGDGEVEVIDVATPAKAKRDQLCFISDKKYLADLEQGRPGAVLAPPGMALPQGMNALRHADPDFAFSKALVALRGEPLRPVPGIGDHVVMGEHFEMGDDTAIGAFTFIGAGVKLGRNVVIYPHCYIGDGVTIGDNTILHPRVTVLERCTVGKRCILHSGVVIGSDGFGFHFHQGHFVKAPQLGIVAIEDDVELGANTTIDRARFDTTIIRKGTKLDNLVHIAHNVQVGQHCALAAQVGIAGTSVLKDYVQIGGQAGIGDHITIGMGAQIAGKSGVVRDVAPGMKMAGGPAEEARTYMRRDAAVRRLPDLQEEVRELKKLVTRLASHAGLPPEEDEVL